MKLDNDQKSRDTAHRNNLSINQVTREMLQYSLQSGPTIAIDKGLKLVRSFLKVDRVYIGYYNPVNSALSIIHEISAGQECIDQTMQAYLPFVENIQKGIDTIIPDVTQIPQSADFDQKLLIEKNVQSTIVIPVYSNEPVSYFLGFEYTRKTHTWSEEEIENMHLFADLFSSFMKNEKTQRTIEESQIQTSRKEEYQASLAKLKLAVNTANSFIWEYNVKKDLISVDFELLGYERSIPLRTSASTHHPTKEDHLKLTHPEDHDRLAEKVELLLKGEISSFTETYRHFTNKKLHWYTTHFSTFLYDKNNKPEIIICLTQDITQQRKKEIEWIKEREANKIKTEFIANVSHELRTPLNAVLGFSSLIANNNDTEANRLFIEILQKNNEILLQLIDSILHFANQESGSMLYKIEEVDLKEICQIAMGIESFNVNPNVKFIFDDNLPSVMLKTDKERIIQVLFHLLDNAKKYTPEGNISLSYHICDTQEVKVEITDTGIGLNNKEIQKIFSHFYKTDTFKLGLGLGLSIAKKTIMDLGGQVGVDSTIGEGSKFWFTLPLSN